MEGIIALLILMLIGQGVDPLIVYELGNILYFYGEMAMILHEHEGIPIDKALSLVHEVSRYLHSMDGVTEAGLDKLDLIFNKFGIFE